MNELHAHTCKKYYPRTLATKRMSPARRIEAGVVAILLRLDKKPVIAMNSSTMFQRATKANRDSLLKMYSLRKIDCLGNHLLLKDKFLLFIMGLMTRMKI